MSGEPYSWVRGVLTLNEVPLGKEAIDLGFNLILAYRWDNTDYYNSRFLNFAQRGGKIISGDPEDYKDENKYNIVAHTLGDEPRQRGWSPQKVIDRYNWFRESTNKPIGAVFTPRAMMVPEWLDVINKLNFAMIDIYPYREGWNVQEQLDIAYNEIK